MSAYITINEIKNYGKIEVNIKNQMEKYNITRNRLASMTNTRFEVINKWYNGNVERIDLDILARLCYVLNCNVEDIVKYSSSKE